MGWGGGSLNLEILRGGRAQSVLENSGGSGGGQETVPSVGGNGFVFGITHCSLICKIIA